MSVFFYFNINIYYIYYNKILKPNFYNYVKIIIIII
nr:MAG TPA: hypothetical protein [Bacteriophage sp.]